MAANTEKSVTLIDGDVQTFLEDKKKPIHEKKNQTLRIQWL